MFYDVLPSSWAFASIRYFPLNLDLHRVTVTDSPELHHCLCFCFEYIPRPSRFPQWFCSYLYSIKIHFQRMRDRGSSLKQSPVGRYFALCETSASQFVTNRRWSCSNQLHPHRPLMSARPDRDPTETPQSRFRFHEILFFLIRILKSQQHQNSWKIKAPRIYIETRE